MAWGSGFLAGAGDVAQELGEGLLAALRRDPRDHNPTGLTPQDIAKLQQGEPVTPPARPGVGESLLGLTPLGPAAEAWKASDEIHQGGYAGGKAAGTALATLATMGLPAKALRAEARVAAPIRAYHASPHDFDRFDFNKIGTGEGHTAYGYGGYFAENPAVSGRGGVYDKQFSYGRGAEIKDIAARILESTDGDYDKAAQVANQRLNAALERGTLDPSGYDRLLAVKRSLLNRQKYNAHIYEVGIHADPGKFLDWDRPVVEQHPQVQRAAEEMWGEPPRRMTGGEFLKLDHGDKAEVSAILNKEFDVPGVRYLDGGSRSDGAGTRNYVVFPTQKEIIEILRKYGLAPTVAGGAAAAAGGGLLDRQEY